MRVSQQADVFSFGALVAVLYGACVRPRSFPESVSRKLFMHRDVACTESAVPMGASCVAPRYPNCFELGVLALYVACAGGIPVRLLHAVHVRAMVTPCFSVASLFSPPPPPTAHFPSVSPFGPCWVVRSGRADVLAATLGV